MTRTLNQSQLDSRHASHVLPLLMLGEHFVNVEIGSKYVLMYNIWRNILSQLAGHRTKGYKSESPSECYKNFTYNPLWKPSNLSATESTIDTALTG